MNNIRTKNPRKVRILGKGKGWEKCPDNDEFEIWGLNGLLFSDKNIDRLFMMDIIDEMPSVVSGSWDIQEVINTINEKEIPIVAPMRYEEIPSSERYPIDEAVREFGVPYFNNTIAYMICYALLRGVEEIQIFGINQASGTEYFYEKGCVEYWLGIATGYGVRVSVHGKHSELLTNKARYGGSKLYGYNVSYESLKKSEERFGENVIKKLKEPDNDNVVMMLGPQKQNGLRTVDMLGIKDLWRRFKQHPEGHWIVSLNDSFNLARLAKDNEPKRVLDLGTGIGASSAVLRYTLPDAEIVSVEQYEKCVTIAENMTENVDIRHSEVEKFDLEEIPHYSFLGYKDLPEGPWDMVVVDGPGDALIDDAVFRGPSGDIFRIIDEINEGGIVYVDGRNETVNLISRYMNEFLKTVHKGKNFAIFQRNNKPYNKKLVVDELKKHLTKNNYFHAGN